MEKQPMVRTRLSNADSDVAALHGGSLECKRLFQAFDGSKLDIAESLWLLSELVLDDTDTGNLAVSEKLMDVILVGVEGEIADVSGIRGLSGEGQLLSDGESAMVCVVLVFDGLMGDG